MPSIAMGTSGLTGSAAARAVEFALRSGYRALDTALAYGNHVPVGMAMRASGVPREEVFLISKVPPDMMGYAGATEGVREMLTELRTGYIDLCLVHRPEVDTKGAKGPMGYAFTVVERAGTWRALEQAMADGQCRHIGVSNYMPQHLGELWSYARSPPAVNQIEYHPYMVDNVTAEACRRHGIAVQAYGSIRAKGLLRDPTVGAVAAEVRRTPSQVLLRWGLQEGHMVLAKSTRELQLLENAELWDFALTWEQRLRLSALDRDQRSFADPHLAPVMDSFRQGPGKPW